MPRKVPRPFEFHWGRGQIVEEATFEDEYTESAIQLLEYEGGHASLRFCYFNKRGQFQRSPLLLNDEEIDGMRESLKKTPRIREKLHALLEEPAKPKARSKRK